MLVVPILIQAVWPRAVENSGQLPEREFLMSLKDLEKAIENASLDYNSLEDLRDFIEDLMNSIDDEDGEVEPDEEPERVVPEEEIEEPETPTNVNVDDI